MRGPPATAFWILRFLRLAADKQSMKAKRWLWIPVAMYVTWLVFAYEFHFVDYANLAFHEAGHVFFSPFGEIFAVAGGTLGQFVFPVACALHFARSRNSMGVAFCGLWFAESGMYMGVYLGDAQAMALPLVGGEGHDWSWMLGRLGLVAHCEAIAAVVHVASSALAVAMVLRIAWLLAGEVPAPRLSLEERVRAVSGIDLGDDFSVLEGEDRSFRDRRPVSFVK